MGVSQDTTVYPGTSDVLTILTLATLGRLVTRQIQEAAALAEAWNISHELMPLGKVHRRSH